MENEKTIKTARTTAKAAQPASVVNKAEATKAASGTKMPKPPVRIKLFKDNDRYKSDVFVSVNGRNYQIRRGVEMEVPAEVAEVLAHSETQDEITARRMEQAAEQAKLS